MTKEELIQYRKRLNTTDMQEINRHVESEKIAKQTQAFLAKGGQIKVCAIGERAWQFKPFSING